MLALLGVFAGTAPLAEAQEPEAVGPPGMAAPSPADTSATDGTDGADTRVPAGPSDSEAEDTSGRPVSPMGAFFRSLVLPGWGQAAVDQPVRGAFYFAMEAGSLWMLFSTNAKLEAARRAGNEHLAELRSDQREDWIVLAVFWALFSGVDAWVSAHLWDFEGAVVPPPDGSAGVAVRYSVPVRVP